MTVKRKGKTVTVTKTFTRIVDEDFAWKDTKAAEKAGMPMIDYVIGGMDRSFKLKLFHTLQAAEQAGLSPGISSAFRDDYRQSLASGLKAATDRSYHGGSFRGGYGHGLAADVVSVKGATQAQRWISTESFWKWIDAHGKEFGIGRPYLDRDPPHCGADRWQGICRSPRRDQSSTRSSDMKKATGQICTGRTIGANCIALSCVRWCCKLSAPVVTDLKQPLNAIVTLRSTGRCFHALVRERQRPGETAPRPRTICRVLRWQVELDGIAFCNLHECKLA